MKKTRQPKIKQVNKYLLVESYYTQTDFEFNFGAVG